MILKLLPIFVLFVCIETQAQTITGTFTGYWAETIWTFKFNEDNRYSRISSGHYGNTHVSGKYIIQADSIVLTSGYEKTDGTVNKYYLIDGDSCIIDTELRYDYCKTRPTKIVIDGETWLTYKGSPKRYSANQLIGKWYLCDSSIVNIGDTLSLFRDTYTATTQGNGNKRPTTIESWDFRPDGTLLRNSQDNNNTIGIDERLPSAIKWSIDKDLQYADHTYEIVKLTNTTVTLVREK